MPDETSSLQVVIETDLSELIVGRDYVLTLQLTDAAGSPVPEAGIPLIMTIESQPEPRRETHRLTEIRPGALQTDPEGQAEVSLIVGQTSGPVDLSIRSGLALDSRQVCALMGQPDRDSARLVEVSGNNQTGAPGEELEEPLVVRLEDQFGNPIPDEEVAGEVLGGQATLAGAGVRTNADISVQTNAQGEAQFRLRVGEGTDEQDVRVRIFVPQLPQVRPVPFLAIVGTVDTPDIPFDLAVFGQTLYVASFTSGLQIIDGSDPANPILLTPIDLQGAEVQLALAGSRLYVGTNLPNRLYILDLAVPENPATLGRVDLPQAVQSHRIEGMAIQNGMAYVLTRELMAESGALLVIDVRDPAELQVLGMFFGFTSDPIDVAVSGGMAYVPAELAVYILDVNDPSRPAVVGMLSDSDPADGVQTAFFSDILLSGDFAYLVETRCEPDCRGTTTSRRERFFTVFSLDNPLMPQRRGSVQVQRTGDIGASFSSVGERQFAYLAEFDLGLRAIDVTDPDVPRFVGRIDTPSTVRGTAVTASLIYVIDQIFGLQVIRGPGANSVDTDGDGVVDFFDVFPADPDEALDTDRDGLGDNADPDDDNDGFSDDEERQAAPPTDPKDPRLFPVLLPPVGMTAWVIDAATTVSVREQNGTPDAPYHSITQGLRAALTWRQQNRSPGQVLTLDVRAGTYSPATTREIFPLSLFEIPRLTLRGAGPDTTIIDAAFTETAILCIRTDTVTIEGFSLLHGADGIDVEFANGITLRNNRVAEHIFDGMSLGPNVIGGNIVDANLVERNGDEGITLFENATAVITGNLVRENRTIGVFLQARSRADIADNAIVNNVENGVWIQESSAARMVQNTSNSRYSARNASLHLNGA
ncbi:right-handed parallel beta-helix repeat-containing protein, partial [Candidatus Entotheonella palauensis]|uniref:right-handed parallel beta-helix repeat-containing protein n=1 Tax=Candidatus Entotheonella palauensis TaxID=93172 RepID=UPI0015C4AD24